MYQNLFACVDKFIPPHICHDIKKLGNSTLDEPAKIHSGLEIQTRNSRIAWLPQYPWICDWIIPLAKQVNEQMKWNFHLNFDNVEMFQFTRYKVSQFYGWHQDSAPLSNEGLQDRVLSFTIMLSSPEEFKGGELQLYDYSSPKVKQEDKILTDLKMKEQGSITFFPSDVYHQVTKVEEGERCSLVVWIKGDKNGKQF